jgi:hypothetical protein
MPRAPKSRKRSAWSIRQETAKSSVADHKTYVHQAGQVLWAWNKLQAEYQSVFTQALRGGPTSKAATAMWHTVASDQLQRDLLETLVSTDFTGPVKSEALSRLRWALKETRNLAQYRNIAAHMPIALDYVEGEAKTVPDPWSARETAAKIVHAIGHKQLYEGLVGERHVLASYVMAIRTVLYGISPVKSRATLTPPQSLAVR